MSQENFEKAIASLNILGKEKAVMSSLDISMDLIFLFLIAFMLFMAIYKIIYKFIRTIKYKDKKSFYIIKNIIAILFLLVILLINLIFMFEILTMTK